METWVKGVTIIVSDDVTLNKGEVLRILSDTLGVAEWTEVYGPDSLAIR